MKYKIRYLHNGRVRKRFYRSIEVALQATYNIALVATPHLGQIIWSVRRAKYRN